MAEPRLTTSSVSLILTVFFVAMIPAVSVITAIALIISVAAPIITIVPAVFPMPTIIAFATVILVVAPFAPNSSVDTYPARTEVNALSTSTRMQA